MKPFNLEQALAGKPVIARNGTPVDSINQIPSITKRRDNVLVTFEGNHRWHFPNGHFLGETYDGEWDLFMAGENKKGWVAVIKPSAINEVFTSQVRQIAVGFIRETKEQAMNINNPQWEVVDIIEIEWSE